MSVEKITATVFKGGGRRWFTLQAAERSEARAAIKKRCECDRGSSFGPYEPSYICWYHKDPVRLQRIIHLYIVMFVRPRRGAA